MRAGAGFRARCGQEFPDWREVEIFHEDIEHTPRRPLHGGRTLSPPNPHTRRAAGFGVPPKKWKLPGGWSDPAASFLVGRISIANRIGIAARARSESQSLSAQEEEADERDVASRQAVIDGDPKACGQSLALAHGPGLGDVEHSEEQEDSRRAEQGFAREECFR